MQHYLPSRGMRIIPISLQLTKKETSLKRTQIDTNLASSVVVHVGIIRHETSKFMSRFFAAGNDVRQATLAVPTNICQSNHTLTQVMAYSYYCEMRVINYTTIKQFTLELSRDDSGINGWNSGRTQGGFRRLVRGRMWEGGNPSH